MVPESGRMRRVTVVDVRQQLPESHPTVVLQEIEPPYRRLDIATGYPEGVAVFYAWKRLEYPRPLTHELFTSVMEQFALSLEVVEITAVKGRTFYAQLTLVSGTSRRVVQSRPSDALALALRQRLPVPVLVDEAVLEEVGYPEPTSVSGEGPVREGTEPSSTPLPGHAAAEGRAVEAGGADARLDAGRDEELSPPAGRAPSG